MLSDFFDPYQPYFSLELETEILNTVTRRLGQTPNADQLAAYRLYLRTIACEVLRRIDAEMERRAKTEFQTSSHRGPTEEAMGIEPENGASESDLDDEVIGYS